MSENKQLFVALEEAELRALEEEHARLAQFMRDLHNTCIEFESATDCQGCDSARFASCRGRIYSFFYDFLDLTTDHFDHEEKLLQQKLSSEEAVQAMRLHQVEHLRLIGSVKALIDDFPELVREGNIAALVKKLDHVIHEMFAEHARKFDSAFTNPD